MATHQTAKMSDVEHGSQAAYRKLRGKRAESERKTFGKVSLCLAKSRYCDRTANERQRMCRFILQPSFLSVGEVSSEVVRKICNVEDMNEVERSETAND
ncbi:hypothetical protein P5673_033145 [Acropora cervicornis]|uniref:Uncharacterized protein n=1 Tax=Acropora cervicornis TaxID=6130 RepID=A0AAD9PQB9_ACRCE|nr:hypothetical protein P5673_033145 [Acropora cervicornis]